MGFWRKVKDAFRPPENEANTRKASTPPPRPNPPDAPAMPPEEAYLRVLLSHLGDRESAPPPGTGSVGGREFWSAIERLLATGRERTAIELLRRFAAARPDDHPLAARLVELLCDRLEHAQAIPYLEKLSSVPEHALRARFLLGEARERGGDSEGARREYERVLALDIDYPKARGRAERLRPVSEAPRTSAAAPTIAGVDGIGTEVSSRYRLQREIGRGAAGAVYLARDQELDRDIALKLLHPHASSRNRTEARARSFNEARIAAALRHPGVVAIYDLDEDRNLIAMELCPGGTLRDLLQRGRLAPVEALRRGAELALTLAAVHRSGIVHRDLKPGNLLFRAVPAQVAAPWESAGDLVLGDFGLAHLQTGNASATAEATGTLGYMAPEARRGEVSPASDLYAVGVILHEMLVGAPPFDRAALLRGETRFSATLPEPVVTSLGDHATREVRAILDGLLAADAAARPGAQETRTRLDAARAQVAQK
jgi:hypothetical protein